MIESGSTNRGSTKCAISQSSGWNPPSWLRSGPMRAVPKVLGLSSLVAKSPGSEIARVQVVEPVAHVLRARVPAVAVEAAVGHEDLPALDSALAVTGAHSCETGGWKNIRWKNAADQRRDRVGEQAAEEDQQRGHQHLLARMDAHDLGCARQRGTHSVARLPSVSPSSLQYSTGPAPGRARTVLSARARLTAMALVSVDDGHERRCRPGSRRRRRRSSRRTMPRQDVPEAQAREDQDLVAGRSSSLDPA